MQAIILSTQRPAGDLANSSFGNGLEKPCQERLAALVSVEDVGQKRAIFYEGDSAEHLFEVLSGVVKLYKLLADGRRQITGFLYPGHFMGLSYDNRYVYTAEAVTDVRLCRYPRARLDRLMAETPGLGRRLLSLALVELVAAQDQMLLLGRKSTMEKVASFLLRLATPMDSAESRADRLFLPMGRVDIADYLGLTVETVSRAFTKLRHMHVIELEQHNRVRILDFDLLDELAEGDDRLSAANCHFRRDHAQRLGA